MLLPDLEILEQKRSGLAGKNKIFKRTSGWSCSLMLILFITTAMSGGGKIGAIAGCSLLILIFGGLILGFIFFRVDNRKARFHENIQGEDNQESGFFL